MLTCYDATMAAWLWRGGLRCFLVGDTAAQMILGHDSTLPISMPTMLELTAAVRRGAPKAFLMGDMPFGSYHCGEDRAMENAVAFLTQGQADCVKMEVRAEHAGLVRRMTQAGIPVVAHIGSRPQTVRLTGGFKSAGKDEDEAASVVADAWAMVEAGAAMLLIEAVPEEVSRRVMGVCHNAQGQSSLPVIGCGAGPNCHGHVVVLHDLLGLTDWRAPFTPQLGQIGQQIAQATQRWVELVHSGRYLKEDHPYRLRTKGDPPTQR
jgi:3-methyl-2-oxobutanoate hydroxymethyltransferase